VGVVAVRTIGGLRRSAAIGAGRAVVGIAIAALIAGCATSVVSLSKSEINTLYIQSVEVKYVPDAYIWWGTAEREYAAKASVPPRPQKTSDVDLPGEREGDAYRELMETPAAKAYVRDKLTGMIKARLQQAVLPRFRGTRAVRLEIEVHNFNIPSPLQRIALGGTPMLGAITVLRDAKTGAELGKLDRMSGAIAGNGLLGVAVDQAFSDLEDRVVSNYADNVLDWLTGT
jgi:hypothetical protein